MHEEMVHVYGSIEHLALFLWKGLRIPLEKGENTVNTFVAGLPTRMENSVFSKRHCSNDSIMASITSGLSPFAS